MITKISAPTSTKLHLWISAFKKDYPSCKYQHKVVSYIDNDSDHTVTYETKARGCDHKV